MSNFSDNDFDMEERENNESRGLAMRIDTQKLKRFLPYLLFLLPALLLTLYAILEATDILPARIYIGNSRIRLVGITDNAFMTSLTVFSYVLSPLAGIGLFAFNLYRRMISSPEQTPVDDDVYVERFTSPVNTERENTSEEQMEEQEQSEAAPTESPVDTVELGEAVSFEETENTESEDEAPVIPDRPEYMIYKNLEAIDAAVASQVDREFTDSFTLDALLSDLVLFFSSKGYSIPETTARRILSAIGAARCIWITGKNRDVTLETVKLIAEYFGSVIHEEKLLPTEYSTTDLSVRYLGEGAFSESGFIVDVYSANYNPSRISFAALFGDFSKYSLNCLNPYIESADIVGRVRTADIIPTYNSYLNFVAGGKITVPSNIWYILGASDATCVGMPNGAIAVDVSAIAASAPESVEERTWIYASHSKLFDLIRKAKDDKYISEEYWKKLDAIEEYIAKRVSGFYLGNKEIRSIERYAAVCLSMNGSIYETLDGVVAGMILPALNACPREMISGDEDGIFALVDRIFGMDNMPFTHEILRKFGVA